MGLARPWWLLLLVAVAALVIGYWLVHSRRRRDTLRFANLELLERVMQGGQSWLRHVPISLLLVALMVLTVGLAGPSSEGRVPRNRATVVLVIDVSLSMEATDVAPSRLRAAQLAAKEFADQLTPGINLGLISFAGTAAVLVSPIVDREPVKRAIDGLKLTEATATGEAIFAAVQSIQNFSQGLAGGDGGPPPARIVLMSDGKQTMPSIGGEDESRGSFTAAGKAAKEKIPISTISFGTLLGRIDLDGHTIPVPVDDASLRRIAQISGGQFFTAASQEELRQVYQTLGEQIGYEIRRVDNGLYWMAVGTLLAMISVGAAFVLNRSIP